MSICGCGSPTIKKKPGGYCTNKDCVRHDNMGAKMRNCAGCGKKTWLRNVCKECSKPRTPYAPHTQVSQLNPPNFGGTYTYASNYTSPLGIHGSPLEYHDVEKVLDTPAIAAAADQGINWVLIGASAGGTFFTGVATMLGIGPNITKS